MEPSRQLEVPLLTTRGRAASTSVPRRRSTRLVEEEVSELPDTLDPKSSTRTNLKRKRDEG